MCCNCRNVFYYRQGLRPGGSPNCPACSGGSSGGIIAKNNLVVSVLGMPTSDDEYAVTNIRYGVFKWLDVGVGYAFKAKNRYGVYVSRL